MSSIDLAYDVLQKMASLGVKEIIFCAGARNAPFLQNLEKGQGIKTYHFFEERAASFFALGRSIDSGNPVAIFTTSGTAVAELLPACIEAYYSCVPLLFVTADRPESYRGSGAPQTIEQMQVLSSYVEKAFDIADKKNVENLILSNQFPTHWNVQFDEPLVDKSVKTWEWNSQDRKINGNVETYNKKRITFSARKPLILLGPMDQRDSHLVRNFLDNIQLPVYIEASSGLRGVAKNNEYFIQSGDHFPSYLVESKQVDGVIRIGGVPTLRFWRDLEGKYKNLPVIQFSSRPFSGLSRIKDSPHSLHLLKNFFAVNEFMANSNWQERDQEQKRTLDRILIEEPQSEPALFRALSDWVATKEVFVGNSLPIREWDLSVSIDKEIRVVVNRGANGIDGQVSTFFGTSSEKELAYGVFGDLTSLYDLTAPWILKDLSRLKAQIIVINNCGGQIFSRLFESPLFRNEHSMNFSAWAEMWNLGYQKWTEIPVDFTPESSNIIEVCPCSDSTDRFWNKWNEANS